ncbi:MAG: 50S ribosomal protein L10 [Pseudomonadota bacterium]
MLRKQKEKIVTELHDSIKDSRAVILTTFFGLNVKKMTDLRTALRGVGSEYRVVKNALLRKASCETDLERLDGHFVGSSAVVFAREDPIRVCKVLKEFKKEHTQVEIKGGILEGRVLSPNDVDELANLPGREVLLAKFLFLLRAPQQRLVNVLIGVPQKLVRVLDAIRQKKEG